MAQILAFAGSNSSKSINYELVKYTASLIKDHEVQLLNMVNFPFPMFSEDYERENGYSNSLVELKEDLMKADGVIISVNEHNSGPSAYFKNLTDWLSRVERKFLEDTPVFLMATSNGKRGGMGALEITQNVLPRFGAEVVASFSLPSFGETFNKGEGIVSADLAKAHREALNQFLGKL
ncbi:NADPH-dependent FMN reductase [Zobellia galactanivorans]|uniref:NADPH-dependent FMN reductase n=1 Tax=Zobellia galactanivorans (strain DSM 12802 / CCUG 47099 / CIP 106680 / NCIMB 13871 / Dsij) TaxID=63186 RepID=UPI001C068E27|nr:NAD(P)H-dependent oxidoreductase [Zobellia galactanivorans]MBU3025707.1 NAD(P)H-dependent oxidoreductase [Zobellia galactanivorans]